MKTITATSQAGLDVALRAYPGARITIDSPPGVWLTVTGSASVEVVGASTVRAYDSSSVWADGSAVVWASGAVTVEASGRSTVHASGSAVVEAYDASSVWASGSSSVHAHGLVDVHARESATVWAYDWSVVEAAKYVAVHRLSRQATITGGVVIGAAGRNADAAAWCDYQGVEVTDGKVVLYKAVLSDFTDGHGAAGKYAPGCTVVARDFEPTSACRQGLHLCASPRESLFYTPEATRFVAVEADVASLIPLDGKGKVPSCVVLREVTIDGAPITDPTPTNRKAAQ